MRHYATLGAVLLAGCVPFTPCGWDRTLEQGRLYDVELVERYQPGSVAALYLAELDLNRPAVSCSSVDGIDASDTVVIEMVQAPGSLAQDCSFWFARVTEPELAIGIRNATMINNRSYNQVLVSGQIDLGGGCVGAWEFSVHAPDDAPFAEQPPGGIPITIAYRVFAALPEAADGCAVVLGMPAVDPTQVTRGDAFVALRRRRGHPLHALVHLRHRRQPRGLRQQVEPR